ncbi:MAG: aminoacyl-tRNA hydrolase [Euryarchaeota archaeon]|nr:aminoacyl-tRNA hydrolase [Euryarchaeota archaeon]
MVSTVDEPSMVFIARHDLKMSAGKLAVQCSHAAVSCTMNARKTHARLVERWRNAGARKICLRADDLATLQRLAGQAQVAGLVTYLVKDAAHTEVPPGTITVLGIGPAPRRAIDALVSELKPY